MTLSEYKSTLGPKGQNISFVRNKLRSLARSWHKQLKNSECQNCGYDKHIEFCHLKPLKDFSDSSTLFQINGSHNIVALCPNCHTELDSGKLSVEDFIDFSEDHILDI